MKVAIVTPYYKEDRRTIERCIASVRAQTVPTTHLLVADGHAQGWIDEQPGLRHLKLDQAHADYGNTPRSVGGILAASEGFDAIGFLDADNWLAPDHVESCLRAAAAAPDEIDYIVARRHLVRDDGSVLPTTTVDDADGSHVDTNCYLLLPGAFHTLGQWGVMPKPLSAVGDRVYLKALRDQALRSVTVDHPTVNYLCTWAHVFEGIGEPAPDYAKSKIDMRPTVEWWHSLDRRDRNIVNRLAATDIAFQ